MTSVVVDAQAFSQTIIAGALIPEPPERIRQFEPASADSLQHCTDKAGGALAVHDELAHYSIGAADIPKRAGGWAQ